MLSMSLIGAPYGVVVCCSDCNEVSTSLFPSSGIKPRVARVEVPLRMLSTTSSSPYGPIASAISPVVKGDVLDILSLRALRLMRRL